MCRKATAQPSYVAQRSCGRCGGWVHGRMDLYLHYIYIYIYVICIVEPLGAYKLQLGGTYTSSLWVYTFIVSCDPIYTHMIYIYIYTHTHTFSSFQFYCCCRCTTGTLHIRIREDQFWQVCFPCRVDKMTWALRGIPFGTRSDPPF